jgi:hypothetical protein
MTMITIVNRRLALLAFALLGVSCLAQAAPHVLPTIQQLELQKLVNPHKPFDGEKVLYYGGPVISNVKAYTVMWGSSVDSTTQAQIGAWLAATVDSSYLDWLKEYNTNITAVDGRQGTNQSIGRGTYVGQVVITPANTSQSLDDTDIQAELDHQMDIGALPVPDGNTLFMIYFPPGVSITVDGQSSCSSFCAYHEGFTSKTHGNVFYGVMPDLGGACSFGCGFNGDALANLTDVSSHEMTESITDPFPTAGSTPAYPQAWNTSDGNEIGDLCAQTSTQLTTSSGATWTLQQEYDNLTQSCAPGPYSQ